jgi:predicted nucleotidyltransferase
VAAHGLPRYTGDLEAWVWIDHENAERIMKSLAEFGFGSLDITAKDFQSPNLVVQLGFPPHRIDLLTGIDGVEFEEAWKHRIEVGVNGTEVPFIGREDLIANKKAAGRAQDLADVTRLEKE